MIAIPAAVGIVSLAPQLLHLLAGTAITAPPLLVPLVSAGAVLHGIYQLFVYVLHLSERTRVIFFWVLLAAAANLALNVIFVPAFGMSAAAATTFISYLILAVAMILHSRHLSIRLNWQLLGKVVISTAAMGAAIAAARLLLPNLLFLLLLGLATYLLALMMLRGIGQRELQLVKTVFDRPLRASRGGKQAGRYNYEEE
jgi:O-antigen/teichoic acid export membrane protein